MAVLVKICGITSVEAADAAAKARADFAGMVFHRTSPRYLDPVRAGIVAERLKGRLRTVALLIDASDDEIAGVVTVVKPDLLQLHGDETPARVGSIKGRFGIPTSRRSRLPRRPISRTSPPITTRLTCSFSTPRPQRPPQGRAAAMGLRSIGN